MNIWYDISGLYEWRGSFTGIQRAVFNIGQSLADDKEMHAKFFIFNRGGFKEVQFSDLQARLDAQRAQPISRSITEARRPAVAIIQHHSMVAAKQIVIGSRIEQPLRKSYDNLRNAYHKARPDRASESLGAPFIAADTVVIVDGNWQFRHFADALIEAKAEIGFRLVHFVHDLVAVKNPALASRGADKIIGTYFEHIFPVADKLLAISESTKRDVEWFCNERGIKRPSADVVILGSDIRQDGELTPQQPSMQLPEEFILAVSTLEVRKNYLLLYYAYKQAALKGKSLPHLIIVGRKGWMVEETYSLLTNDPEVHDKITVLSGITDKELEWLYRNCLFTVFPSFYEGWGLPIAESLLHNKCCVSSNTSSMPEVGGDLVRYVSPYDTSGLIKAIEDGCDAKSRAKMEARIKAEFKPITWQDTYVAFIAALI